MPSYSDLAQFFQHAGADVVTTLASIFAFIIITNFRGIWHTDREFRREEREKVEWRVIAKGAVENTVAQQKQIETLTDVVEKLTAKVGRSR